jgi:hypothetical protein
VEVIVFNATSNNISAISFLSVLLVENLMLCISLDTAFSIQNYVINFVCDLWQVEGKNAVSSEIHSIKFSTNKTDRHDIAEILLEVALNTITSTHRI